LFGPLHLGLLARGDVGANRLGVTLHRLGGDLQARQQFQLRTALLKARLAAHHRQHTAHSRRTLRAFHVQLAVARSLSLLTVFAVVVGPP
jgi:hypothetical protein